MRKSWTDARLDDFRAETIRRFDRVDQEFRDLRGEMNRRFDALNRTLLHVGGGMIAALIAGFMGLIATQL